MAGFSDPNVSHGASPRVFLVEEMEKVTQEDTLQPTVVANPRCSPIIFPQDPVRQRPVRLGPVSGRANPCALHPVFPP